MTARVRLLRSGGCNAAKSERSSLCDDRGAQSAECGAGQTRRRRVPPCLLHAAVLWLGFAISSAERWGGGSGGSGAGGGVWDAPE